MAKWHPEQKDGEVFLGNWTKEDWSKCGWRTKRVGILAYTITGEPYPFQEQHRVFPGFALKSEDPERANSIEKDRKEKRSDEKLREMIAEKDAEIERLKTSDWAGVTETLTKSLIEKETEIASLRKISQAYSAQITEKDAEIARLKTELSPNWAKHESTVKKPLSIKEAIESINSGPGWVTAVTISRTEWERLLTAIEEIEKDAERYRKLKGQFSYYRANNPIDGKWFILRAAFRVTSNDTLDSVIDDLPEVQS